MDEPNNKMDWKAILRDTKATLAFQDRTHLRNMALSTGLDTETIPDWSGYTMKRHVETLRDAVTEMVGIASGSLSDARLEEFTAIAATALERTEIEPLEKADG